MTPHHRYAQSVDPSKIGLLSHATIVCLCAQLCLQAAVPSKGFIVFGSKRSGAWRIWRMDANGANKKQLSSNSHGAVMPVISPDGKWVLYKRGNSGAAQDLWVMRNDGSEAREVVKGTDDTKVPCAAAWGTNGFHYQKGNRIFRLDPETGQSVEVANLGQFPKLSGVDNNFRYMSADGRWILLQCWKENKGTFNYDNHAPAEGGAVIADTQNKGKLYYFGDGCEPSTPPSGNMVYHVNGAEWPNTNIMKMNINDIQTRSSYAVEIGYPDKNWGHEYWPKVSNDNKWMIYGASTGCHPHYDCPYDIFVHQLGESGDRTNLTNDNQFDNWPDLWVGDVPSQQDPGISLSQTTLTFSAFAGEGDPAAKTITVTSVGGQSLSGLAAHESATWLTVAVSGSGDQRIVTNTVSIAGMTNGNYEETVEMSVGTITKTYDVTLGITDKSTLHIKINAGDNTVPGWQNDVQYTTAGSLYGVSDDFDVSGVTDPGPVQLYQTCRHQDPAFTFAQVPDGDYTIRLHFADPAVPADVTESSRAMNVFIEGRQVLKGYDIVNAAGGGHKAVIEEFAVTVADGNGITIAFDKDAGNDALVCGIEIIAVDSKAEPVFSILSPRQGDVLSAHSNTFIEWTSQNAEDAVVELSIDGGLAWTAVNTGSSLKQGDTNWGKLPWTVPATPSKQCMIRIGTYKGEGVTETGAFEIGTGDAIRAGGMDSARHPLLRASHNWNASTLDIAFAQDGAGPVVIELFDTRGRLLTRRSVNARKTGRVSLRVPAAALSDGVYFVRAVIDGRSIVRRVSCAR